MKNDLLFINSRDVSQKYEEFDTLGFSETKDLFLKIFGVLKPPVTLGLYGHWGSGKTEMVKALSNELNKDYFVTLVFDAWKYRNDNNLILPIMCALEKKYLNNKSSKGDSALKVIGSAAYIMINQALKNKIGIGLGEIKDCSRDMEKEIEKEYKNYREYCDIVSELEIEYQSFMEKIAKDKTVVIFIDNLDRCLPDVVVNLIEDISTLFHSKKCVFVLSMDEEIVIKAIENKYIDFKGKDYLEKIVQVSLSMPKPTMETNREDGAYHFMKRYEICKVKYYDNDGGLKLSKQNDDRDLIYKGIKIIKEIFNEGIVANPRRIERLVNNLILLENVGAIELESESAVSILLMLVLKIYLRNIFDLLEDQGAWKDFLMLIDVSVQSETSPFRIDEFKNTHFKNYELYNMYRNNRDFWKILKVFYKYKNVLPEKFNEQIQKAKASIGIIG